jgi:hypothetical protein
MDRSVSETGLTEQPLTRKQRRQPRHGQNYHQWLSSQYGLRKLTEHIWMVIGIAKTCSSMIELKDKMAQMYGKVPVQYTMYLPPEKKEL